MNKGIFLSDEQLHKLVPEIPTSEITEFVKMKDEKTENETRRSGFMWKPCGKVKAGKKLDRSANTRKLYARCRKADAPLEAKF